MLSANNQTITSDRVRRDLSVLADLIRRKDGRDEGYGYAEKLNDIKVCLDRGLQLILIHVREDGRDGVLTDLEERQNDLMLGLQGITDRLIQRASVEVFNAACAEVDILQNETLPWVYQVVAASIRNSQIVDNSEHSYLASDSGSTSAHTRDSTETRRTPEV